MRIAFALLASLFTFFASAQPYPGKPIRFVVATGPGGGDDFVARLLAPKLSEILGQQVFVENRPGAGGMVGQTFVARSAPDGYTVLLAGGSMAGAKFVNATITYDLLRDFTPVSLIETAPFALVVSPSLPASSVSEFIALAKSRPGRLNYGTLGAGQIPYWAALLFNSMTGIQAQEIQYKSPAEATTDVMTGRIDYWFSPMATAVGAKEKVRILGVTTPARSPTRPDLPAVSEGLPGFQMPAWRSMMGPAGPQRRGSADAEPCRRAQPRGARGARAHGECRLGAAGQHARGAAQALRGVGGNLRQGRARHQTPTAITSRWVNGRLLLVPRAARSRAGGTAARRRGSRARTAAGERKRSGAKNFTACAWNSGSAAAAPPP